MICAEKLKALKFEINVFASYAIREGQSSKFSKCILTRRVGMAYLSLLA
jgi:hypothetical protein